MKATRRIARALERDLPSASRQELRRALPPLHQDDCVAVERLLEAKLGDFALVADAIEVEMLDRRVTVVPVAEGEGRAAAFVAAVQRAHDCAGEGRFSRAERPRQRDDLTGSQRHGEFRGDRREFVLVRASAFERRGECILTHRVWR